MFNEFPIVFEILEVTSNYICAKRLSNGYIVGVRRSVAVQYADDKTIAQAIAKKMGAL